MSSDINYDYAEEQQFQASKEYLFAALDEPRQPRPIAIKQQLQHDSERPGIEKKTLYKIVTLHSKKPNENALEGCYDELVRLYPQVDKLALWEVITLYMEDCHRGHGWWRWFCD
jgi:hypothetical protein